MMPFAVQTNIPKSELDVFYPEFFGRRFQNLAQIFCNLYKSSVPQLSCKNNQRDNRVIHLVCEQTGNQVLKSEVHRYCT